jgi:hypothetical protein
MDKEALLNHTYCLVFFKINIAKLFFISIFLINFDSIKTDKEMNNLKVFRSSDSAGNHFLVRAKDEDEAYNKIRLQSRATTVYRPKRA